MSRAITAVMLLSAALSTAALLESELVRRFGGSIVPIWRDYFGHASGSAEKEHVAVVLISDRHDADISAAWPLPFSTYTRFVVRAWCFGARSVFIDVIFSADRGGGVRNDPRRRAFAETVTGLVGWPEGSPRYDELWARHCVFNVELPRRRTNRMPVFIAQPFSRFAQDELGHASVTVGLKPGNVYVPEEEGSDLRTAAFALAAHWCEADAAHSEPCRGMVARLREFEVVDSFYTPIEQAQLTPSVAARCAYSGSGQFALPSAQQALASIAGPPADSWSDCPPVLTVDWAKFFGAHDVMRRTAAAVTGRAVVLGASIAGARDEADTDFHKGLPGVYLHALATRQLLSATQTLTVPPPLGPRFVAVGSVSLVIIVLFSLLGCVTPRTEEPRRWRQGWLPLGVVVVSLCLLSLIYDQYRWSVTVFWRDALSLASCHLILVGIEWRDPFDWLHRWIQLFGIYLEELTRKDRRRER